MDKKRSKWRNQIHVSKLIFILVCISKSTISLETNQDVIVETKMDHELKKYVDRVFSAENVEVVPGVKITKRDNATESAERCDTNGTSRSVEEYFHDKLNSFARTHLVSINVKETGRFLFPSGEATTATTSKQNLKFINSVNLHYIHN